jgi:RHS repeat-associated protein
MKQAQPTSTGSAQPPGPPPAQKTATGFSDTRTGSNIWQTRTFTAESQWGVRYTQSDPLPSTIGFGFYGYARNNPLGWIDPNGLTPTPPTECPAPEDCVCEEWKLVSADDQVVKKWNRWGRVRWRPQEDHIKCWCDWRLIGEFQLYRWRYKWKAETACFPCYRGDPVEATTTGPLEERYQPIEGGREATTLGTRDGNDCDCDPPD